MLARNSNIRYCCCLGDHWPQRSNFQPTFPNWQYSVPTDIFADTILPRMEIHIIDFVGYIKSYITENKGCSLDGYRTLTQNRRVLLVVWIYDGSTTLPHGTRAEISLRLPMARKLTPAQCGCYTWASYPMITGINTTTITRCTTHNCITVTNSNAFVNRDWKLNHTH